MIEIHCKERNLGGNVGAAKTGVEVDAVEQVQARPLDADAVRMQVAVAIADAAGRDPPLQQRRLLS